MSELVVWLDGRARPSRHQAADGVAGWPFTRLLCALALIQLLTLALLVRMVARSGFTVELVLIGWFVGNNSGWDTDSWFTLYTLVGLSRHADHHAHAARPYQALRRVDESPKLPRGYYAMVSLAQMSNRTCQALLTQELWRRKLGPFRDTKP